MPVQHSYYCKMLLVRAQMTMRPHTHTHRPEGVRRAVLPPLAFRLARLATVADVAELLRRPASSRGLLPVSALAACAPSGNSSPSRKSPLQQVPGRATWRILCKLVRTLHARRGQAPGAQQVPACGSGHMSLQLSQRHMSLLSSPHIYNLQGSKAESHPAQQAGLAAVQRGGGRRGPAEGRQPRGGRGGCPVVAARRHGPAIMKMINIKHL